MTSSNKIAVHSLADLKNTTDDALCNYLNSLKFTQSNYMTDVRLALGYTAVIIAGVLFYFDWTLGWEATKVYTGPAVVVYFLLNGAFTYWMWAIEKGTIYSGESMGTKIRLSSHTDKHVPIYKVTAHVVSQSSSPKQSSKVQEYHLKAPFTRWFTSDGFLVAKPFQQWLASEVSVIGEADPANVVEEIGRGSLAESQNINVNASNIAQVLGDIKSGKMASGGARNRKKA